MNRLPVIKNFGRFSFVIDLYSWCFGLHIDRYPALVGWTYRVCVLCFNLHFRTHEATAEDYRSYYGDCEGTFFEDDYTEDARL